MITKLINPSHPDFTEDDLSQEIKTDTMSGGACQSYRRELI